MYGEGRECGHVWGREGVWACMGKGGSVGMYGEGRECGHVWGREGVWACMGKGGSVGMYGEGRECMWEEGRQGSSLCHNVLSQLRGWIPKLKEGVSYNPHLAIVM